MNAFRLMIRRPALLAVLVGLSVAALFVGPVAAAPKVVAAVQYSPTLPTPGDLPADILKENVNAYENIIHLAQEQQSGFGQEKVSLFVFPEDGLFGPVFESRAAILPFLELIPDPSNSRGPMFPCYSSTLRTTSPTLVRLSCLAIDNSADLVVHMGEIAACDTEPSIPCPADGHFQFSTVVALSSAGQLMARYRKTHLYFEPQFDPAPNPRESGVVFTTSFGARLGIMVCFDALFEFPTSAYVDLAVDGVVMPTWWVNVPPLTVSIQIQQAYSRLFQLNLIAANTGYSGSGSGSGIYVKGVPANVTYCATCDSAVNTFVTATVDFTNNTVDRNTAALSSSSNPRMDSSSLSAVPSVGPSPAIQNMTNTSMTIPIHASQCTQRMTTYRPTAGSVNCQIDVRFRDVDPTNDFFTAFAVDGFMPGFAFPLQACGIVHCPYSSGSRRSVIADQGGAPRSAAVTPADECIAFHVVFPGNANATFLSSTLFDFLHVKMTLPAAAPSDTEFPATLPIVTLSGPSLMADPSMVRWTGPEMMFTAYCEADPQGPKGSGGFAAAGSSDAPCGRRANGEVINGHPPIPAVAFALLRGYFE